MERKILKFKNVLILLLLLLGMAALQMMMAHSSESILTFKTDTATAVFNLEVAGNNDFYVSASKVLVHNCDGVTETVTETVTESARNIANKKAFYKEQVKFYQLK